MNEAEKKDKKMPHEVRDGLTHDIGEILKVCIHEFREENDKLEDRSFDIDAVLSEKVSLVHIHASRKAAKRALAKRNVASRSTKGSFIPHTHFQPLFSPQQ